MRVSMYLPYPRMTVPGLKYFEWSVPGKVECCFLVAHDADAVWKAPYFSWTEAK